MSGKVSDPQALLSFKFEEIAMETNSRVRFLQIALVLVGLIFIFGVYPLMMSWWPSGWRWQPNQPEYEQMILGVYATLGVFLLLAARNPLNNLSLIWFTVWSSLVHAGIMAIQAMKMPSEHGHLYGDVPALVVVAILLAILTPRGAEVSVRAAAA
jgi:hypothetical protein